MKCKQVQAALAVAPREWSEAERQQIETHLPTCTACTAIARDYTRQADRLTALPRASLSMAQQQAILAQVLRAPQTPWSRRLVNAFGVAAGVLILGALVGALLWVFNNPTSLSLTATVTSVLAPTMTATPTMMPASSTPAPPSPAPAPTVLLPNGAFATPTIVTPDPVVATEFAVQQATQISSRATEIARATQSPFPTAGPVVIQTGQPASVSVQRGGLTFELRLPKDTYLAGEGGQAEVRVTNNGAEAIFIRDASSALLDAQGDEPQPWPWEAIQLLGIRGLGWGTLTPGQTLTRTLKFQLPPLEQMVGKSYQLGAALDFYRTSLASPQAPDEVYLRAETGLIPLHVIAPTAAQQLTASLEIDENSWRLHVVDADGRTPPGPLWGSIEAGYPDGAMSGPLQDNTDGQWSGQWGRSFAMPGQAHIFVRAWIAAPGYVTAAVTQTLPADSALSGTEISQRFGAWEPRTRRSLASLEEAQAALNTTIYRPSRLPAGAALADIVQWDSVSYDGQRPLRMNLVQTYRLPNEAFLTLSQAAAGGHDPALWGTARYAPDAQQVTVNNTTGYLIQHFGFWLLDWTVNDQVFELHAPVSAVSLEQLLDIAAGVQPLR